MLKTAIETLLSASRWLLAPFYVALVVALLALVGAVVLHAYRFVAQLQTLSEQEAILGALNIVDLVLVGCLIVLVVFSTYSSFVSPVAPDSGGQWPVWMLRVDDGALKLKLVGSVVAVSSIRLLEASLTVDRETNHDLKWQLIIFAAFVGCALLLALSIAPLSNQKASARRERIK